MEKHLWNCSGFAIYTARMLVYCTSKLEGQMPRATAALYLCRTMQGPEVDGNRTKTAPVTSITKEPAGWDCLAALPQAGALCSFVKANSLRLPHLCNCFFPSTSIYQPLMRWLWFQCISACMGPGICACYLLSKSV